MVTRTGVPTWLWISEMEVKKITWNKYHSRPGTEVLGFDGMLIPLCRQQGFSHMERETEPTDKGLHFIWLKKQEKEYNKLQESENEFYLTGVEVVMI